MNLDEWMRYESPTKGEVDTVTVNVCAAVAALHSAGVAHRDLKPQQLCFRSRGPGLQLKLLDVDMSAWFKKGLTALLGLTPAFAAPEALRDRALLAGPEVDVYAVGLILAQLRHPNKQQVRPSDPLCL